MFGDNVIDEPVFTNSENASDEALVGIYKIVNDLNAHQGHRHSAAGNAVHPARNAGSVQTERIAVCPINTLGSVIERRDRSECSGGAVAQKINFAGGKIAESCRGNGDKTAVGTDVGGRQIDS